MPNSVPADFGPLRVVEIPRYGATARSNAVVGLPKRISSPAKLNQVSTNVEKAKRTAPEGTFIKKAGDADPIFPIDFLYDKIRRIME